MKYEWILFDIDNTLLDFDGPSKQALQSTFNTYDIAFNEVTYNIYKDVNIKVWAEFEQGKITAKELRPLRFKRFFDKINMMPCSPIEFNTNYLNYIIEYAAAYDLTHKMLEDLSSNYKISVITNGLKEVQRPRLERLGMTHFFDSIIVSDEIGVAKPHKAYFDHVFNSIPNPSLPSKTIVVGDNLHSDIKGGNAYGCHTCWISHGQLNQTDITPDHTIHNIAEFNKIL